ncbi:hypothetical protein VLK31_34280 [Variovorax sp. H27-G14]|uniref:hypothetical protein n=1 Tax=Variovorax sp. H27-G14 TaxID=3111914 RepID=UPI0038FC876D
MKIAKLTPIILLPIHFFVYLTAANFRFFSFDFDAIYLGWFFGLFFWWILVYPIYNILGAGGKVVLCFSILVPLVAALAAYASFSFDITPGVTAVSGSKVYVENGVYTDSYAREIRWKIVASIVGVLIEAPFFYNFLNYQKSKK